MSKLRMDLQRKQHIFAEDGAKVSLLRVVMSDGTSANIIYRCMRWCAVRGMSPVAYFFQYLNKFLNGCVIGIGAEFDDGFVIMHPVGIVINSKVRGGLNVTLESSVVIGDEKGKSPILLDNIFIGSGAKIVGQLVIESNVKVGANAVVTKDALEGSTMLGIPARPYRNAETGDAH